MCLKIQNFERCANGKCTTLSILTLGAQPVEVMKNFIQQKLWRMVLLTLYSIQHCQKSYLSAENV